MQGQLREGNHVQGMKHGVTRGSGPFVLNLRKDEST